MMFVRPSQDDLQALAALVRYAPWKTVEAWLQDELEKTQAALRDAGEPLLIYRAQGRAQLLGEFLGLVAKARP